jgi:hypothetical protein
MQRTRSFVAGVVGVGMMTTGAMAQQAVQWRVEDGGNGHWYRAVDAATGDSAIMLAASLGGNLATIANAGENAFVKQVFLATGKQWAWLGLRQASGQATPGAGWYWVTGEPLKYLNWTDHNGAFPTGAPDDSPCALPPWGVENGQANQGVMDQTGRWDDLEDGMPICGSPVWNNVAIIEWSADCNNDGLVDYGQIRDGSLPDYNGNNVPDCCESGSPCVLGNYPVQWRVQDGGNGHWYAKVPRNGLNWVDCRPLAENMGGYLATPTSAAETSFLVANLLAGENAAVGGYQDASTPDFYEPSGGWRWVTGEPWSYQNWSPFPLDRPEPNNWSIFGDENWLTLYSDGAWNDGPYNVWWTQAILIEWSADCNNDGIVDYGQILSGELADANGNGVPDCCDAGTSCIPCLGDVTDNGVVNGIDLAALLAAWGGGKSQFDCDIDNDGSVGGSDLAIVLAGWGACP